MPISTIIPFVFGILATLLIFPADVFRRWLWYLGGPFLVLTAINISTISVRGGGIITPTRVGMAELLMQMLVVLTIVFVVGYYVWRWYRQGRADS